MMIVTALLATVLFTAGAIWLHRTARARYGGTPSPLPPARIHDGRTFRGPVIEGRNRAALAVEDPVIKEAWVHG